MGTMSLSSTVSEIQRDSGGKLPILTYFTSMFGAPVGVNPLEFRRDFWHQQTKSLGYRTALLS